MDDGLEFCILGSIEVRRDGIALPIGGPRPKSVLAYLLLRPNQTVAAERIVDAVWPDTDPIKAPNLLQVNIRTLRKGVESNPSDPTRLLTRAPGYRIAIDASELDAGRAERLIAEARLHAAGGETDQAVHCYQRAVACWRGDPLAEFAYEQWAVDEIVRLEELHICAVSELNQLRINRGEGHTIVGDLESLTTRFPLREMFWVQRMHALYSSGRQADALRAFSEAREVLLGELGIGPGPDLVAMERAVLDQDPELLATRSASPTRLPPPSNASFTIDPIPSRVSSIVGRDALLDELEGRVLTMGPSTRIFTLVGPGGIGKTTLALELARRRLASQRDVVFVDLTEIDDSALVLPTLAKCLGIEERPAESIVVSLAQRIGGHDLLVVLDNVEHVLAAAPALAELLARTTAMTILATSRAPLRLAAEQEFVVPALDGDHEDHSAAIELFVDRARSIRPEFNADMGTAEHNSIRDLCRRLDALPLAIELAAQGVRVFTPTQLLAHVEQHASLRLDAPRGTPQRHRTLEATAAWSLDLLPDGVLKILDQIVVFSDWFTFEDADAIVDVSSAELTSALVSLVEHSLVRKEEGATTRLRLLFTVRMLRGIADVGVRRRHAEWFGARASSGLAYDDGNLRSALRFALDEADVVLATRVVVALAESWVRASAFTEAMAVLQQILELSPRPLDPDLAFAAGIISASRDDFVNAVDFLELACAGFVARGDSGQDADALISLCDIAALQGRIDDAESLANEALQRAIDDGGRERALRMVAYLRGWVAEERGQYAVARDEFEAHLDDARSGNDAVEIAYAMITLAELELLAGNPPRVTSLLTESGVIATDAMSLQLACYRNRVIGMTAYATHEDLQAIDAFARAVECADQLGRVLELSWCIDGVGALATRADSLDNARKLMCAADALRQRVSAGTARIEREMYGPARDLVFADMDAERRERLTAAAARRTLPDVVAMVDRVLTELRSAQETRA